jgi:D-galacturonate reductase
MNFFSAWMSQPKSQLKTFSAWAGKDSDISYYLSSHHIDICCWMVQDRARPTRVVASAATGIATGEPYNCVPQTEDTITLLVDWQSKLSERHRATAVYTASWTAPQNSGVHSAQHWYYMAEKVRVSYFLSDEFMSYRAASFSRVRSTSTRRTVDTISSTMKPERRTTTPSSASFEPICESNRRSNSYSYNFFSKKKNSMKYSPSESGHFDGQRGYGYISIEKFIDAARSVAAGETKPEDYDKHGLPTIANTVLTTAILHAGRISLDEKRPVGIKQAENGEWALE